MDVCPPNVHESFWIGQAGSIMIWCKPNATPGGLDNGSYSRIASVYLNDRDPEMMVPFKQIGLEPLTIRVATTTHYS